MKRFSISLLFIALLVTTACTGIVAPKENGSADKSFDLSAETSGIISNIENSDSSFFGEGSENAEVSVVNSHDTIDDSVANLSVDRRQPVDESSQLIDDNSSTSNSTSVFISNGILISGTRGMEQYFGLPDSGTKFSKIIENFKNDLGDKINVYTVVAPHSSCYNAPESYSHLLERGRINFDNLKASCSANVCYVDVYNALWDHVDEEIYPRTEFHWSALAGYYAAQEFAKAAKVTFAHLESYKKIVKSNFIGSAYTFSKAAVIANNPEDFVIYMPLTKYKAYYCDQNNYDFSNYNFVKDSIVFDTKSYAGAFICGDNYSVKIETSNNSGRKLVLFKDSYGNAFAPFVVGSFDEIYILDIRYYKRNGVKFCQSVGATDVAFVVSGFTATGSVYKRIETIRTAAY